MSVFIFSFINIQEKVMLKCIWNVPEQEPVSMITEKKRKGKFFLRYISFKPPENSGI